MGIVTAHAPKLVIIAGILILALKELCNQAMELLGLSQESTCNSGSSFAILDAAAVAGAAGSGAIDDSFQYPYQQLSLSNILSTAAASGASSTGAGYTVNYTAAMVKASLVPLLYRGKKNCIRKIAVIRSTEDDDHEEFEEEEEEEASEAAEDSLECAVCLCEFERGQELKITPNCGHVFHSDCIHKWVELDLHDHKTTCPLCRTSLRPPPPPPPAAH